MKDKEWLKEEIEKIDVETSENFPHYEVISKNVVLYAINQLDEPEDCTEALLDLGQTLLRVQAERDKAEKELFELKNKQPEKVVVPAFVGEWIEKYKPMDSLRVAFIYIHELPREDTLKIWIENGMSETFARAWLDGYTVEKERPHVVKVLENLYLAEPLGDTASHRIITTWDIDSAYKFTDPNSINAHVEKFEGAKAVPVEEEEF